jgi:RNA polymerase sigma factor (sigma-70 family)
VNDHRDSQLLRAYAERRSEPAFTELVRRHVDLVYSAALRMVCDSHLAQDVTQSVFLALAKNAARLTDRPVLSGWLHSTAQNIAAQTVRTDMRRRAREQEAAAMNELLSTETDATWEQIAPYLDAALGELKEAERDALLSRYFERKSAQEMAETLGISAEAAQKRVSRAVERLRESFAKRGVTVGASGLVVISANAIQAAPIGLAVTISTATALAGAAIQTSTAIAATKAIAMTTFQKMLVTVVIAASLATPLLVQRHAQARLREQDETLRQRTERLARLRTENERLSNLAAQRRPSQTLPSDPFNEVLKLRGEIGRLQTEVQELTGPKTNEPLSRAEILSSMRQLYSDRIKLLKEMLAANPAEMVPELQYLTDNDWLDLVTYDHHRLDPDNSYLLSSARSKAQIHFAHGVLDAALTQYGKNNQGQFPKDLSQLAPYFKSPADASMLQGWAILPTSSLPSQMRVEEDWVITQKAPVNAAMDQRIVLGMKNSRMGMRTTNDWFVSINRP